MKRIYFIITLLTMMLSHQVTGQCLSAVYGVYPSAAYTPTCGSSCSFGSITTIGWAGEYSIVNVTSGNVYTFKSSNTTDYITISNSAGTSAIVHGTGGVNGITWTSNVTGSVRFYTHANATCASNTTSRTRSVCCVIPTQPAAPCLSAVYGAFPSGSFTPVCGSSCTQQTITSSGWAGEYSRVSVIAGNTYTFRSSVSSDNITIANNAANTLITFGTSGVNGVTWVANFTGVVRFYTHTNGACGSASVSRTRSVCCVAPAPPVPNPCNSIANIAACGSNTSFSLGTNGAWDGYGSPFATPGGEQIYTFTPSITAVYPITVTNNGSGWVDLFYKTVGACNNTGWTYVDDVSGTATNNITLNAGQTYYFLLDDEDQNGSTGSISIACPCIGASIDANFANEFSVSSSTTGACNDCSLRTSQDRTYKVDITCAGTYTFSTCGATWDTYLYLTTAVCGGTTLASNDDACGLQSEMTATLSVGTYYLTVEGFSETSNGAFTLNVSASDVPQVTATTTSVSCNGGSNGSITASGTGGCGLMYSLNGGAFTSNATFSGLAAGLYSITAMNSFGNTSIPVLVQVTEPTPLVANNMATAILCNGDLSTVMVSTSGGTAPYQGTGSFIVPAGQYTYQVTDAKGCTASTSVTITEPAPLTASNSATVILCNGDLSTVTVNASGGTAPYQGTGSFSVPAGQYTYQIADANGCSVSTSVTISEPALLMASSSAPAILCNGGTTTVTVAANGGTAPYSGTGDFVVSAGTHTFNVVDANGCSTTTTITVTEPTPLVASNLATAILCNGDLSTVIVNATGGTAPYQGTGSYTVPAGQYTYQVTDANGCSASTSVTITEPTLLMASSSAPAILCNGGTTTVTVAANGGTAPYSGTGDFVVGAGTHTFTVVDANGCTTTTSITLTQPAQLVADAGQDATVYFGYNPMACTNLSGTANGGTPGYTYNWLAANNLVSSNQSQTVCPSTSTVYTLQVTDANGCVATDDVNVCVIDVICYAGNSGIMKVQVCHNGHTICVSPSAIPAHLAHGDQLGDCDEVNNCAGAFARSSEQVHEENAFELVADLYPNPATDKAVLSVSVGESLPTSIWMIDMSGRKVATIFEGQLEEFSNTEFEISTSDLETGAY
ncbi:MAG: hypothetical protein ACOVO3_09520, partial [Fluviicola sp.]